MTKELPELGSGALREALEKLRALSDKATPGDWRVFETLIGNVGTDGHIAKIVATMFQPGLDRARADAPFIVACVNFVRAALSLSSPIEPAPQGARR